MKIKVSFFTIMLMLSLILSASYYSAIPLLSAALHESGHIIAARSRGVSLDKFDIGIFGAKLSINNALCSYVDEIIICAAGPAVNLISADIALILREILNFKNVAMDIFILSSLSLAAVNLLPIKTFDGGRILCAAISNFSTPQKAEKTIDVLSFFLLFILWSISVYLILKTSASLSLFVFSAYLFVSIFTRSP